MLAYRHAFHAGNHADVLKHIVLMLVLRYMNQKDKPYRFIDTHAGAGGYSLKSPYAQKKSEFEQGIGRLWPRTDLPSIIEEYLSLIRLFNSHKELEQYPGSPSLAQLLCRTQDQLRFFELHPTDSRILESCCAGVKGVEVKNVDGFDALKSQVPPPTRRGVVLMDPSYEGRADYNRVVASLRDALVRFADGVYIIWYPQVQKLEAAQLPRRLEALAPKSWLHARLTVQQPDVNGFGLVGSGVFVINPPFTLNEELNTVMPYLTTALGQYDGANYLLERKAV